MTTPANTTFPYKVKAHKMSHEASRKHIAGCLITFTNLEVCIRTEIPQDSTKGFSKHFFVNFVVVRNGKSDMKPTGERKTTFINMSSCETYCDTV